MDEASVPRIVLACVCMHNFMRKARKHPENIYVEFDRAINMDRERELQQRHLQRNDAARNDPNFLRSYIANRYFE